jgi:multiple sugar transport system ATP-binding protein
MAAVELVNVDKRFGGNHVIANLNLDIADGEFAVLVGPSGCGKSTTLQMVAGLESISGGQLLIGGRDVTGLPPKDRDISMVFQSYALFPHMTVHDNIAYGLKLRKTPKEDIARQIGEVSQRLQIDKFLDRLPKALSGGQRQRVALARAVVRRPGVFLMDEPLSNLDAKLRVEARSFLVKMHHELRTTTVYVTHDQAEAMTMGSKVVVMNDGVIQQAAAPLVVYNAPVNRFVAGFIGSPAMNFIELGYADGHVYDNECRIRLAVPEPRRTALDRRAPARVVMGVRPEHFHVVPRGEQGPLSRETRWTVDVTQHLGHGTLLDIRTGPHHAVARAGADDDSRDGEVRSFSIDTDKVHFFDVGSGVNLALSP